MGPRDMKIQISELSPAFYPGISFLPATEQRVIVMAAMNGLDPDLKPGTVVTRIDGKDARKYLEEQAAASWKKGGFFSSPQRARLFEYRIPLQGEKGEIHRITVLAGKEKELKLASNIPARGWPHVYNMPKDLARGSRSCFYGKLPEGFGYIYLRQVDPTVEQGIAKAVESLPDVKGWIVDLRGNGGGGYGSLLKARLSTLRKPVAGLIDEGCISAGETLARDLVRVCDAKLFGSTTAGSSSAKRIWKFPSGIGSVSLPVRGRSGINGRGIEFYGIEPDVPVEAVPEEVQQGQNSCIQRAVESLAK
jgi:C-terminal processing protease CtpA/Prc